MGFSSLLTQQIRQGAVFLTGSALERAELFGSPPPELPSGDHDDETGRERIAVENCQGLREAFSRWLVGATRFLSGTAAAMPAAGSPDETAEREYRDTLRETLCAVAAADRRQGLLNLFWLAHSRDVSEQIERHCHAATGLAESRYRLHPLLSGIMRRAHEESRTAAGRPHQILLDFRRGENWNGSLVSAIIDDQLALTEADPRGFNPQRVLIPANTRFRIGAGAFVEIGDILRECLQRAVAGRERGILAALQRAGAGDPPAADEPPAAWDRLLFSEPVREQLLHDLDGAVARLLHSRMLQQEISRERTWSELLEAFAEVTRCVRRAEAVHLLRSALDVTMHAEDDQTTRERSVEGRLYRFGPAHTVQSGVRTATILFADIRGFTIASEGAISEQGLARELYEIFDPAAIIVQRFGGTLATYLGDGFMATFMSGGARPGQNALAAVRTAVVLQQVLGRMRRLGRTGFRMGISLHTGRVALARFLKDEQHASTTVIGRQVNIAGRLSASQGDPAGLGADPGARVVGNVALDGEGRLVNHGIVASGPLLEALRAQVPCEPFSESGIDGVRWYDPDLCLWLHFGYVGVARLRGLEAAVPVYSLGHAVPSSPGAP